jgi:hypothetical protein
MTEKMTIWGRNFDLSVEFDHYDESLPSTMVEALKALTENPACFDEAYPSLVDHCIENDGERIRAMSRTDGIDNIFRYVMPEYLYVLEPDRESGAAHRVALMCDYRFDPEEGLALVFEEERLSRIVPQSSLM